MILHTVKSSPYQTSALENCLSLVSEGDGLLLIQDGVIASAAKSNCWQQLDRLNHQGRLYVLTDDLHARGLNALLAKQISYGEFVELTLSYDSSLSW